MLVLRTLPTPDSDVWYLAYGSNLDHDKFVVDRGIVPLSSELVTMPGWSLEMNSAGFPYSEPSFASVTYWDWPSRQSRDTQVIGTAYKLTPKMYTKVLASEGGGIAYAEVEARVLRVANKAKSEVEDEKQVFTVRTLVTAMRREAKPSLRYMELIRNGAREAHVPGAYQDFLEAIPVYKPSKSTRARLGAKLFRLVWSPVFSALEKITKDSLVDSDSGDAPPSVVALVRGAVYVMWFHHDYLHAPIWGRGDGM
ncbi:hypothetical protein F5B22DRAFT_636216 [Xylaria bambusicola]|uniref:uncharacterized protein n=1 Tax=Xylaria bambusicola TaxID=326684 RepID=UPI002007A5E3|nr:uncharacterized protein F5B22DRAFT_636216 [Xylaria bambusicola]KAI0517007.1 hypothetical protein F5B22DRAFT_636216 [Xylaria bambusicola]